MKRHRIAIDFSSFDRLNLGHGLYHYGIDLIRGLAAVRPQADFILLGSRRDAPPELSGVFGEPGSTWRYERLPRRLPGRGAFFLDQFPAAVLSRRLRPDLIHSLDYFAPFAAPCRLVMTVYDLMDEILSDPRTYRRSLYLNVLRMLVRPRIRKLIAISNRTSRDLKERWGIPPNLLSVVHLGTQLPVPGAARDSHCASGGQTLVARYSMARQKNMPNLLLAVGILRDRFPDLRLVLYGEGGVSVQQNEEMTKLLIDKGIESRVDRVGLLSEGDLDRLIRRATILVLPSLYEGFGLSLVEAMARGVCVLAHRDGAMAEVVGDAGCLVDARSPESLAAGLAGLLDSPETIRNYASAGIRRAQSFSIEKMAERTFEVYRDCLA